jgi:hypothetical protein
MLKLPPSGNEHIERDTRSRQVDTELPDGLYLFAQDSSGIIYVLPDEQKHQHVTILGGRVGVKYAGDMEIMLGKVRTLTNCSGTFQCTDRQGLLQVAAALRRAGLTIEVGGVQFFSWDEVAAVEVLE